jgi:predicted nucleotidyltransferase
MVKLLKFLKDNENARKIFGQRELKIIEKQLWGQNLTQSEKNRLSRDIRKKFQFIKDISKHSEEFSLKKAEYVKEIINNTKEIILEDKLFRKIKRIILFGSYAENQASYRSDIDIAIEFKEIDLKEATKFRIRIHGKCGSKVDIQVYNVLPKKIKKEIDKNGKTIYKR